MCALFLSLLALILLLLFLKLGVTLTWEAALVGKDLQTRIKIMLHFGPFRVQLRHKAVETGRRTVRKFSKLQAFRLLRAILQRVSKWEVRLFTLIGTGDAASTALCCGMVDILVNAMGAALLPLGKSGRGLISQSTPSFDQAALKTVISGIIRFRLVQIMFAIRAWQKGKRRDRHDASN